MARYQLNLARRSDARQLAAMSQQLVETGLRPAWSASRITWHMRHEDSVVLTGRDSDGIAGFAIMRYGDDTAHLNLLAVDPVHRRRGLGRLLMLWLEQSALTAGTFLIGLELRATNAAAFSFYSALGYRELGQVSGYYQGVENAIRMTCDLRTRPATVSDRRQPAP
jgi:ribosomal protein S18 acetylase RimI-like enzyme